MLAAVPPRAAGKEARAAGAAQGVVEAEASVPQEEGQEEEEELCVVFLVDGSGAAGTGLACLGQMPVAQMAGTGAAALVPPPAALPVAVRRVRPTPLASLSAWVPAARPALPHPPTPQAA